MNASFFKANRQRLYKQLKPNSLLVLTANGLVQRNTDYAHMFEQEANFWYMTGVQEADWWLLVDVDKGQEWLIAPKLEWYQTVFDGALSHQAASRVSGITQVLDRKAGVTLLQQLLGQKKRAYTLKPYPRRYSGFYTNRAQFDLARRLKHVEVEDVRLPLAKLRAIKQPAEIKTIQAAIDATVQGIEAAVKALPNLTHEYQFESEITYHFRRHGIRHAYDPVVAAGKNAITLHHDENDSLLTGPFLLFDIGARVNNYCADITRTVPLGSVTKRHAAVFAAVERVHYAVIDLCQPGKNVAEYLGQFEQLMRTELMGLGLVGKNDTTRETVYKWMPHAISHGLGIDVHDSLGRAEVFQPGMVLTVEPGIYISDESIGVRLEDDILITKNGPKVLSKALPIRLF